MQWFCGFDLRSPSSGCRLASWCYQQLWPFGRRTRLSLQPKYFTFIPRSLKFYALESSTGWNSIGTWRIMPQWWIYVFKYNSGTTHILISQQLHIFFGVQISNKIKVCWKINMWTWQAYVFWRKCVPTVPDSPCVWLTGCHGGHVCVYVHAREGVTHMRGSNF